MENNIYSELNGISDHISSKTDHDYDAYDQQSTDIKYNKKEDHFLEK